VARLGSGGVGIKIVALDEGQRPGEISIRAVLVCGLGGVGILFDREHLAWHDRLSKTRVIRIG